MMGRSVPEVTLLTKERYVLAITFGNFITETPGMMEPFPGYISTSSEEEGNAVSMPDEHPFTVGLPENGVTDEDWVTAVFEEKGLILADAGGGCFRSVALAIECNDDVDAGDGFGGLAP